MRAVLVREPGGPEKLNLENVPEPSLSSHQVMIEVHATALNRADILQRRGVYPPPSGESEILGLECAGKIREVGRDVSRFAPGDRVMALLGGGGYSEYVSVHPDLVMKVPDLLSFEEAAAVPEAFLTAYEALLRVANLSPGERLLVHAAASGVGSAALQIGREIGAFVIGTTRGPEKLEKLQKLGLNRCIDVTREDFQVRIAQETQGAGVDVIADLVGGAYAEKNQLSLASRGRWIVIGLVGGARASIDLSKLLSRQQTLSGIVMRTRPLSEKSAIVRGFSSELLPWFADKRLRPQLDQVFPLEEVATAHARMEANQNFGKIVLRVR